jgi:hypothetical protein
MASTSKDVEALAHDWHVSTISNLKAIREALSTLEAHAPPGPSAMAYGRGHGRHATCH